MKKSVCVKQAVGVAVLGVLGVAASAFGGDVLFDGKRVREELTRTFPKLTVTDVEGSLVKDLYEITSGENIYYYNPASGVLVFGEMWTKDGENITAKKREKLVAAKASGNYEAFRANIDKAIKVGNGKHEVIEITDPDCPFCRKMHSYWESRKDVTRYVFLAPIPKLHPKAEAKSKFILGSADKATALNDVYSGKYDVSLPTAGDDKGLFAIHSGLTGKSGINGTPAFFVDGKFVHGADVAKVESIIGSAGVAPK